MTAVHAKDPYLKQFYNDIYAQGREEYLDHVDDCLSSLARDVERELLVASVEYGVSHTIKVKAGDPYEEIVEELENTNYSLLVVGRRVGKSRFSWRSRDLATRLVKTVNTVPILVVPGALF